MLLNYSVSRYGNEWAIFCGHSKCFVLFGTKKEMEKRCKELNEEDKKIIFPKPKNH